MKEILLYGALFNETIVRAIRAMDDVKEDDGGIVLRINSEGGSVEDTWGAIAKFSELKVKKTVKVDGGAHSMGAFFLAYADNVEAADFSRFTLHRAAFSPWIEQNEEYFTEDRKAALVAINKSLRKALESRVNSEKFEAVTGVSFKELFSLDSRIDVQLTAAEAKKVGLVDKVVKITPTKRAELNAFADRIAAHYAPKEDQIKNPKSRKMTVSEFKNENPEAYEAVVAEGVAKEKARAEAFLQFVEVDAKGVKAGIEAGAEISSKEMVTFARAEFAAEQLASAEAEAPTAEATETPEVGEKKTDGTEAEAVAAVADFMAEAKSALNLNSKS